MKTQLYALLLFLLALSFGPSSFAQCDLNNLSIVVNSKSADGENCKLDVTVSFTIDKNPGNKYTYLHLWAPEDYPSLGYKKAPGKQDLEDALATIAILTDEPAKLLQSYGPDNTVPTLYDGLTFNEQSLGDKLYKITISNITVEYPGSCEELKGLKGDVWSTQSEADKHPPVHCVSTALPVKLAKFNGELLDQGVGLSWVTTEEQGSSHFDIERSADLKEFIKVGRVKSAGNTAVKQSYNFIDNTPFEGANYYRLKMVDFDGSSEISKIVYVDNGPGGIGFQLLGNPVTNGEIRFILKNESINKISLYDLQGKQLRFNITQSGNTASLKPITKLTSGIYLLRLNNDLNLTKKVIVLP